MTVARLGLVVAVLILAAPLAIEAQQAGKVYRIGVLEVAGAAPNAANLSAFRQGLAEHGYVEGQNFVIEYRSADGRAERFSDLYTPLIVRDTERAARAVGVQLKSLARITSFSGRTVRPPRSPGCSSRCTC